MRRIRGVMYIGADVRKRIVVWVGRFLSRGGWKLGLLIKRVFITIESRFTRKINGR